VAFSNQAGVALSLPSPLSPNEGFWRYLHLAPGVCPVGPNLRFQHPSSAAELQRNSGVGESGRRGTPKTPQQPTIEFSYPQSDNWAAAGTPYQYEGEREGNKETSCEISTTTAARCVCSYQLENNSRCMVYLITNRTTLLHQPQEH